MVDVAVLVRRFVSVCRTSSRTRRSLIASRMTTQQSVGSHSCSRIWTTQVCLQVLEQLQCRRNHNFSTGPALLSCMFMNILQTVIFADSRIPESMFLRLMTSLVLCLRNMILGIVCEKIFFVKCLVEVFYVMENIFLKTCWLDEFTSCGKHWENVSQKVILGNVT